MKKQDKHNKNFENLFDQINKGHECCYHNYHGILMMVVPDGHIIQKCCKCECMRTVHREHTIENNKTWNNFSKNYSSLSTINLINWR